MSRTKSIFILTFCFFLICPASTGAVEASSQTQETGTQSLCPNEIYENWQDTKRNRCLPVKIYLPSDRQEKAPVIIFSHGLGGSRESAAYLGKHWSQHGYVCVFIQHPGSDETIWKPKVESHEIKSFKHFLRILRETVKDPIHAINRANDIPFAVDQLELKAKPDSASCLAGKIDLDEIAVAGHSFGSWTALTASGQKLLNSKGEIETFTDPRVKAAIYLSPTCPRKVLDPKVVFGEIAVPGLHFTGTKDSSPIGETKIEDRRTAFDCINRADQYLVILNRADHMVFNGRPKHQRKRDITQQEIIARATTQFLDAYLKKNPEAMIWLHETAYQDLAKFGTFEQKTAKL